MLTLSDAKSEPIVRRALEGVLLGGEPMPAVWFGSGEHHTITARLNRDGRWSVIRWFGSGASSDIFEQDLTTDDAIARIVSTARGI